MLDGLDVIASEKVIREFERDGAICLRGVFDRKWIDLVAHGVDIELVAPGPLAKDYTRKDAPGRFFGDLVMWERIPQFRAFVFESPAAEIAGRIMRSTKVNFYHDHLLIKEPGTGDKTPWHHDQPYYFVNGRQLCSIWMPLDPVDRETCVRFVSGSHNWGRWFSPRYFIDGKKYYEDEQIGVDKMPDFDSEGDDYEFLCWDLEPGDCIVFHALTIHGASGNHSLSRRRRAYATRWMGDDARFAERPGLISPQINGHGLKSGDKMDCEKFPLVWEAALGPSR